MSFTTTVLHCLVPAPPPVVWRFISDPEHINRWSTAPVQGLEPGDGGGFAGVGALRQVVLPPPLPPVTEAIQYAEAPRRFVYRAVGSRAVRYHRGELRLSPDPAGTHVRWEVGVALPVPGMAAAAHRLLGPQLRASVRRLAAEVRDGAAVEFPARPFLNDEDPDAAPAASATAQAQRNLADEMREGGDARHWFSRVYQYVTEAMIEDCNRGEIAHATWGLRLIPRFHELYARNLDGPPEAHWRAAFDAIESATGQSAAGPLPFWRALVAGARAHIEGDLPQVLAATYAEHYAQRCDYQRFRADFLLLATPLGRAWQRLSSEVPARWFPPYLRLLDRLLPREAIEHLTAKRFYDPLPARRDAFERGGALVAASPVR